MVSVVGCAAWRPWNHWKQIKVSKVEGTMYCTLQWKTFLRRTNSTKMSVLPSSSKIGITKYHKFELQIILERSTVTRKQPRPLQSKTFGVHINGAGYDNSTKCTVLLNKSMCVQRDVGSKHPPAQPPRTTPRNPAQPPRTTPPHNLLHNVTHSMSFDKT